MLGWVGLGWVGLGWVGYCDPLRFIYIDKYINIYTYVHTYMYTYIPAAIFLIPT